MKKLMIFLLFPFSLFSQGFIIDQSDYNSYEKNLPLTRSILPNTFSLEEFTHSSLSQGQYGMCTSYALASIQSIIFAKINNITDINQINNNLFSSSFLYFLFKDNDDISCSKGMDAIHTIKTLIEFELGIPKKKSVEENKFELICDYYPYTISDLEFDLMEGSKFRFDDCYIHTKKLKNGKSQANHKAIKQQLLSGYPSLLSIPIDSNFQYEESNSNCKKINSNLEADHAVVIIGFDDFKFGGSYRILNSWGDDWEDKGKAWVKYSDLDAFMGNIISIEAIEIQDVVSDAKYWSNMITVFNRDFKFMNDTLIKR